MSVPTCPICCNSFNTKDFKPMILQCGHTIWNTWTKQLSSRRGTTCPTCRIIDSRQPLSPNYYILQSLKPPGILCDMHDSEVEFYWMNENQFYCSQCIDAHKTHDFYHLNSDSLSQEIDKILQNRFKQVHDEIDPSEDYLQQLKNSRKKILKQIASHEAEIKRTTDTLRQMIRNLQWKVTEVVKNHYALPLQILTGKIDRLESELDHRKQFVFMNDEIHNVSNINKLKSLKHIVDPLKIDPIGAIDYLDLRLDIDKQIREIQTVFANVGKPDSVYFPMERENKIRKYSVTGETHEELTHTSEIPTGSRLCMTSNGLYIVGGRLDGETIATTQIVGREEQLASMRTPRRSFFLGYNAHIMYAIGGVINERTLGSWEKFNTITNTWEDMPELTMPRSHTTGIVTQSKILIFGGKSSNEQILDSIEVYDYDLPHWRLLSLTLPSPATGCIPLLTSFDDVVICGGFDGRNVLSNQILMAASHLIMYDSGEGSAVESFETPKIFESRAYAYDAYGKLNIINLNNKL